MEGAESEEIVAALRGTAERTATPSGGGTMAWHIWGEGRPLLLLHGSFGSWNHWLRNIQFLSGFFQVLAPDMPGYGDSALPAPPPTPESLAETIAAGIDAVLGPTARLALAGFSFGGIVAGHLAARLGRRITHLVLIGPNGMALPFQAIDGLRGLDEAMGADEIAAVHRHNLGRLMLADPAKVDDLAVHLQIENARRARFKSGRIPASDSLLRALPRVRARISGIWGGADAMALPHIMLRERTLRRFQPDLDFRVIPDAGHWVPYEAADAVNRTMREMLAAPAPPPIC